jgi:hypothetical protein
MTTVSRDWGRAELNPRERLDSAALGMNAALEWIRYGRELSCSTWCGGFTSAASSQCSQSHPYRRAVRAANVGMRSPRRASVASTCNADPTGKA